MQSAGPVREEWQSIQLAAYLFQSSEFGHWKVTGGYDAFAFRHPSLAHTDVHQLLEKHIITQSAQLGRSDSLQWLV